MFRLSFAFAVASIVAIGFLSYVNAESVEDSIFVPFEWNGKLCGWTNENQTKWACEYDKKRIDLGKAINNGTDTIPDPTSGSTTLCPDRFYLAEDNVTCLPIECEEGFHHNAAFECVEDEKPVEFDKKVIPFLTKLDNYEDKPPTTFDELNEKWKLEHLSKCWYGLDSSKGIQTEDWFVTSTWFEDQDKVYASDADLIDEAIDLCEAQTKMLNILGAGRNDTEVRSPQSWHGIPAKYHGDVAANEYPWTQDRVNQEANMGIDSSKEYCKEVTWLSLESKRYLGCVDPTKPTVIVAPKGDGTVETQNDVEDKWQKCINSDCEEHADEIRAKILAEKTRQIYALKQQTQPDYSITEEIKKIESKGWSLYPLSERPAECSSGELTKLEYLQRCGE